MQNVGFAAKAIFIYPVEYYLHEDDVENWCLKCFFEEYDYCGDCGRAVLLDDLHEAESGGLYCEKCYPYYADED